MSVIVVPAEMRTHPSASEIRGSNSGTRLTSTTTRGVEEQLLRAVPAEYLLDAHHWLLLHGRYVCKARVPDCPRCPVVDLCEYRDKTLPTPQSLPLAGVAEKGRTKTRTRA